MPAPFFNMLFDFPTLFPTYRQFYSHKKHRKGRPPPYYSLNKH